MTEWDHDNEFGDDRDGFYLSEGLLNLWWNPKTCAKKDFHSDPPRFVPALRLWLADHPNVLYLASPVVGPPMWQFPTRELREEFKEKFLETEERMKKIIDAGVAVRNAEDYQAWVQQGERRCPEGRPVYYSKVFKRDVLVSFDPMYGGAEEVRLSDARVPHDLFSHEDAWRSIFKEAVECADETDQSYRQHELEVFDRVWKKLKDFKRE